MNLNNASTGRADTLYTVKLEIDEEKAPDVLKIKIEPGTSPERELGGFPVENGACAEKRIGFAKKDESLSTVKQEPLDHGIPTIKAEPGTSYETELRLYTVKQEPCTETDVSSAGEDEPPTSTETRDGDVNGFNTVKREPHDHGLSTIESERSAEGFNDQINLYQDIEQKSLKSFDGEIEDKSNAESSREPATLVESVNISSKTENNVPLTVKKKARTNRNKCYKCTECHFSASWMGAVKQHMSTHTGEKPLKCPECDYSTSHKNNLKRHMLSHTGERPLKCPECDHTTTQIRYLKQHMSTHTGHRPFKCPECDYSTSWKTGLKEHMSNHTGEKPFKCSECNFSTSRNSTLKLHLKTHSGERPYTCSECNYSTSRINTLNQHMLIHTGKKPYVCSECNYSTARNSHLKRHITTHIGK